MPTISGVWKWNDNPTQYSDDLTEFVSFKTNNQNFGNFWIDLNIEGGLSTQTRAAERVVFYNGSSSVWLDEAYKTMDFGTDEQEVSQDFYNYLTANATKQEEPIVPTTTKSVSNKNLTKFKQKCDETYATIGNIPTVSTELVNLGTLSTSGTLTTDQVTQIGTTTIGVTARASVNNVTRFYERVNISGTTATLVSADDDALHVLTVNLSTRAYTLSDVALGGGGGPEIPTPTTADNGKVLGVANGAYALQEAGGGGGGTKLYSHQLTISGSDYYYISSSETPCNSLLDLQASNFIFGCKNLEIPSPTATKFVISVFLSKMLYINVTGTFQGVTGADFAVIDLSSATILDTVTPL